jgi:dTDP-glucose 4,6-dehydratase
MRTEDRPQYPMSQKEDRMNWTGKRVLVTGAGGFIGSHLVEGLVRAGANVRAFVRYNSRSSYGMIELLDPGIVRELDMYAGDLRDSDAVERSLKEMEVVLHLGAVIPIPYSYVHPREVAETNVMGTLNLLQAARSASLEKIVITSTSEVYGSALYVPIDEKHPQQAQSPYSATKIAADKLAESYHCSYDLPIAVARLFNVFGPRQSARAVVPTIITQALSLDKIHLGAMYPVRDFTYVTDAVAAFMCIAASPASIGEVINIGTGHGISVGDLVDRIVELADVHAGVAFDALRIRPEASEVVRLICDNSKARELLGWTPTVTLDEGLRKTIEWTAGARHLYKASLYAI